LQEAQPDDILELDELWSFVYEKSNQQWLWSALCRRTRQIVAYVIGDRSINTCRRLYWKIPYEYRKCYSFSDFWKAYQAIMPEETHQCVGKESGETAHMERWYNTCYSQAAFELNCLAIDEDYFENRGEYRWSLSAAVFLPVY
jgi:IS1 family transposase